MKTKTDKNLMYSICGEPIEDNDYIRFTESDLTVCTKCLMEGRDGNTKTDDR